jgi:nicotinamidase-related amidase
VLCYYPSLALTTKAGPVEGKEIVMSSATSVRPGGSRLSELVSPDHCALLVQEVQRGVVEPGSGLPALAEAASQVHLVEHAGSLLVAARRAGVAVVHCTAENLPGGFGMNRNARLFAAARKAGLENIPGSESVQPVADLGPEPTDIVLPRYHGLSPMSGSPLDPLLRNGGITTVVVIGVSVNIAIQNLVFDAVNRSYQVVVVSVAIAGVPQDYARQVIDHTLSLLATIVTTDQLVRTWADT